PARAARARGGLPAADHGRAGRPAGLLLTTLSRPGEESGKISPLSALEGKGETAMAEWLEEDLSLLTGGERAPRVLDQRMIREPIRYLAPRPPLCLAPSDTVIEAVRTMR